MQRINNVWSYPANQQIGSNIANSDNVNNGLSSCQSNSEWNSLSNVSPSYSPNVFSQLTPAQMLLLQQQFSATANVCQFDLGLLALHQQQQHQQQQLLVQRNNSNSVNRFLPNQTNPFSSSFSVNSLLNSSNASNAQTNFSENQTDKFQTINATQQQQQQQLAAAMLTQHLAAAVASYRIQNQQQQSTSNETKNCLTNQLNGNTRIAFASNESVFQQPPSKRSRQNEAVSSFENQINLLNQYNNQLYTKNPLMQLSNDVTMNNNALNSSMSSISSPSSSSASSSSLDFSNQDLINQQQNINVNSILQQNIASNHLNSLDYLNRFKNSNNVSNSIDISHFDNINNYSAGSSSMCSLNESNEYYTSSNHHSEVEINSTDCCTQDRASPASSNDMPVQKPTKSNSVRRSIRKPISIDLQNPCCPICGLTLRINDLQTHFDNELEKLEKVKSIAHNNSAERLDQVESNHSSFLTSPSSPLSSRQINSSAGASILCSSSFSLFISNYRKRTSSGSEKNNEPNNKTRYLSYLKIKESRHLRLKNKLLIRSRDNQIDGTARCPLCSHDIPKEQINLHLEQCSVLENDNQEATIERDDEKTCGHPSDYETYEWALQKRTRGAVSMLKNSTQAIGDTSVSKDDFEGELNVDSDDLDVEYGKPQFTESDLIPIHSDDNSDVAMLLRKAVIGKDATSVKREPPNETQTSASATAINGSAASRCLICMKSYTNALVSVNCWHVYCKQCWLQSLSDKKLCPQCNVITCPKDLRKIFL